MTITALAPKNTYSAAAGQLVYAYTFKVYEASEILVLVNGVERAIRTVSGLGDPMGGQVTIMEPIAAGDEVIVQSDLPYNRVIDYSPTGPLTAETLNRDLDRVVAQIKQLRLDIRPGVALAPGTSGAVSAELPLPVPEAVLGWNATATAIENNEVLKLPDGSGASGRLPLPIPSAVLQWNSTGTGLESRQALTFPPGVSSIRELPRPTPGAVLRWNGTGTALESRQVLSFPAGVDNIGELPRPEAGGVLRWNATGTGLENGAVLGFPPGTMGIGDLPVPSAGQVLRWNAAGDALENGSVLGFPPGTTNVGNLPAPSAGQVLKWNAAGDALENGSVLGFPPGVHGIDNLPVPAGNQVLRWNAAGSALENARGVILPSTAASTVSSVLPTPAANQVLRWNAAGSGLENSQGVTLHGSAASTVSPVIPAPAAGDVLGWNAAGTALENVKILRLPSSVSGSVSGLIPAPQAGSTIRWNVGGTALESVKALTLPTATGPTVSGVIPAPQAGRALQWNAGGTALENVRALTLSSSAAATVSGTIPAPVAGNALRWNATGTALENFVPGTGSGGTPGPPPDPPPSPTPAPAPVTIVSSDIDVETNVVSLFTKTGDDTLVYIRSFLNGNLGGGMFRWESTRAKNTADGGTIIDPTSVGGWTGSPGDIDDFLDAQGDGTGNGCWVRADLEVLTPEMWGAAQTADDSPSFEAAVEAAAKMGKGLLLQGGRTYNLTQELVIARSGVILQGGSSNFVSGAGSRTHSGTATVLRRITNTGTSVVRLTSQTGNAFAREVGSGLKNLEIDGNGLALQGVMVRSHVKADLQDLYIHGATTTQLEYNALAAGSQLGALETEYCQAQNITINAGFPPDNANPDTSVGIRIEGNSRLNHFQNVRVFHDNNIGILFGAASQNVMDNVHVVRNRPATRGLVNLKFSAGFGGRTGSIENAVTNLTAVDILSEGIEETGQQGAPGATSAATDNYISYRGIPNLGPTIDANSLLTFDVHHATPTRVRTSAPMRNGFEELWGSTTHRAGDTNAITVSAIPRAGFLGAVSLLVDNGTGVINNAANTLTITPSGDGGTVFWRVIVTTVVPRNLPDADDEGDD